MYLLRLDFRKHHIVPIFFLLERSVIELFLMGPIKIPLSALSQLMLPGMIVVNLREIIVKCMNGSIPLIGLMNSPL
jgi:hypothetical protein